MNLEQAIDQHKDHLKEISNLQEVLFSNNLKIDDIQTFLTTFTTTRDKLQNLLFIINEIGFSRPFHPPFFNELFSILSPSIRTHFTSDEVASIFHKSPKNYVPLFRYGCLNIQTIIDKSYLSEGVFKMFHIVIQKHDPIYYQIRLQKASPSLKTFILKKDPTAHKTVTAIQTDNCNHIQTVAAQNNLNLSSKIPLASSQINDRIKHAWQMPSMLEYAAMEGSLDTFKYLLLSGAEITDGLSGFAVRGGNYEIIHILEREKHIQFKECDVITAVKYNRNDLADYLVENYGLKHSLHSLFEAFDDYNIEYFLSHFQILNEVSELNPKMAPVNCIEMWHQKRSLLHIAAKNGFIDLVRMLLDVAEIDINQKSAQDGFSALQEAVFGGFLEVAKLLVERGSNVEQKSFKEMTSLHLASMNGHFEIVKFLNELSKSRMINQKDSNGDTALHLASKNGFDKIVNFLIHDDKITVFNDRNNDHFTPLFLAIKNCRVRVVDVLCSSEKVDVNIGDDNGSPLQMAVAQNVLPLVRVLIRKSGSRLNINASNMFNANALQQALKLGYNDIAMALLDDPRIDITVKNNDNRNVLSYAAETGNIQIVRKILSLISNLKNEKNGKISDENKHSCQNINNNNNNNNNNDNNNNTNSNDEEIITIDNSNNIENDNQRKNVNENDAEGNKDEIIDENEIKISDYSDDDDEISNDCHVESLRSCDNDTKNANDDTELKKISDNQFDINDVDFFGQTALHLAAKCGHFEIMKLLIDAGIDKNKKNSVFSKMILIYNISIYIF